MRASLRGPGPPRTTVSRRCRSITWADAPQVPQIGAVAARRLAGRSTSQHPPRPRPDLASDLACPHFGTCPGCALQHGLETPPTRSAAASWFEGHGVAVPPPAPAFSPHGWRARARLAVRRPAQPWWDKRPSIGLFAAGTHVVVDVIGAAAGSEVEVAGAPGAPPPPAQRTPANTACLAHHPRLNAAAAAVAATAAALSTAIYADADDGRALSAKKAKQRKDKTRPARPATPAAPGLRYLQVTAVAPSASAALARPPHADPEAAVQLVLVWGGEPGADTGPTGPTALADALWAAHGPGSSSPPTTPLLHSIAINYQPHPGNAILGEAWEEVGAHGDPASAWQVCGGAVVSTPPAAFSQASPAAFGRLLSDAGRLLDTALETTSSSGITLADLFAGSGAVGLALAARWLEESSAAARIASVRAVDVNAAGGPALAAGAAALADRWSATTTTPSLPPPSFAFVASPAGAAPSEWLAGADVAVVDPPRKGLDGPLLAALASPDDAPPPGLQAVLYIACHFPSLARDGDALLRSGHWRLAGGVVEAIFPGADSVEAAALFVRV